MRLGFGGLGLRGLGVEGFRGLFRGLGFVSGLGFLVAGLKRRFKA